MPKLIKWKVAEAPTGQFRSFAHRCWPTASYPGDKIAAQILCNDSYSAFTVRSGSHEPLKVMVADYSVSPSWQWRVMKARFSTLDEAKAAVLSFVEKHPEMRPEDLR